MFQRKASKFKNGFLLGNRLLLLGNKQPSIVRLFSDNVQILFPKKVKLLILLFRMGTMWTDGDCFQKSFIPKRCVQKCTFKIWQFL